MKRSIPIPFLPAPPATWQPTASPLSPSERWVIAVFIDRWRRGYDVISIGVPEIVVETGIGETAVKLAIGRLVESGLLVKAFQGVGRGRVSTYRLGHVVLSGKGSANDPFVTKKGSANDPFRRAKRVAKRVGNMPQKGRNPSPSIEEINGGSFEHDPVDEKKDHGPPPVYEDTETRRKRLAAEKAARLEAEAKSPVKAQPAKVVPLHPTRESEAG